MSVTAYHALFPDGEFEPAFVSVDSTRTVGRQILREYAATNIHDHTATIQAASALGTILRSLLDALDAERGESR